MTPALYPRLPATLVEESAGSPGGQVMTAEFVVGAIHEGFRLDRFLAERVPRLSRQRWGRLIAAGRVRCNGQVAARPGLRVRADQRFTVERPAPVEPDVPRTFDILYEDEHLLVLDKPAGLPVHPSARFHRNTLTHVLRERLGPHSWCMAHRLDRETSGVLVLARRGPADRTLKRAFAERRVTKAYMAVVHGDLRSTLDLRAPLGPALRSAIRIRMGVRPEDDGGAPARTEVEPLTHASFQGRPVTLVCARPRSGRQHQIRVHLEHAGFPIVGDKIYGADEEDFIAMVEGRLCPTVLEARLGLPRQALHAASIRLQHPHSREPMTFSAPWPHDLAALVVEAPAPSLL